MAQCNFVDNVLHRDANEIYDEVILNSDIMANMAASPEFARRYISPSEISIGVGYTMKLEDDKKNLYKNGKKCEQFTSPEIVIADINQYRGTTTSRIGITISMAYGLHMSPDKSFQFYKRQQYFSDD